MGTLKTTFKEQPHSFTKKLLPWTLYALFPLTLVRLCIFPFSTTSSLSPTPPPPPIHELRLPPENPVTIADSSSSPPSKEEEIIRVQIACDYSNGKWVKDKLGPLYNGTSCGTIKDGQNCMAHGRPDMGYLYWRWKPNQCSLPRFDPKTFLKLLENKHLAFVGDSMARNQLESLLCMLGTASNPSLVYKDGEDNKFRRWHFPSHNASVSIYWSPFLVKGVEKSRNGSNYNKLYLDLVDERWAFDLDHMDMIVLSVGHWFLHPAVYFYGDSSLGCHFCPGQNYTEIGFYEVFGKAFKTTLKAITEEQESNGRAIDVIVTTFSPHHFEGDWDKFGACSRTEPLKEGDKKLEGMDAEMRKNQMEEVEVAKENASKQCGEKRVRIEALDVTNLALMRPDGHPGPYMYPNPFANGVKERVQNDCVHWCMPGPVDTWNEILLDVMRRWESQSTRTASRKIEFF